MKIRIENFGPVKDFSFDTDKSFHLIVGDNNVGKSYVLTAYYFIIKSILELSAPKTYNRQVFLFSQMVSHEDYELILDTNEVKKFQAKVIEKKSTDIDATSFFEHLSSSFLQSSLADEFSKKIKSSYSELGSIVNSFSDSKLAKITITVPSFEIVLEGNVEEFHVTKATFGKDVVLRTSKQNRSPALIGGKIVVYKHTSETVENSILSLYRTCVVRWMGHIEEAAGLIVDVNYLPASRSGLYQALSAFGQIIAELSKSRSFLSSRIELPGISGQLSDYFIKLSNIAPTEVSEDAESKEFEEVAANIEHTVLKGRIEYDFKEKKLYYRPAGTDLRLDLSATSSMVSETAPIVAYIRHIISWNSKNLQNSVRIRRRIRASSPKTLKKILIIEEPEAHLHPKNQVKMTQFYADLANLGVNIIMTSHSNYVFNKVSNLVIEKRLPIEKVHCDLFKMTPQGSIGEAQLVDIFGIDDKNFSDASEDLANERFDLLEKMEF
ncbi:hypothetical protein EIM14_00245 [Pseudomonas aeruginosa]|uniref:AAA family ATPase n=1 Tax=Pseudomonas aeruginosa TaxID=287 RepID=UPI0002297261|nr:AAA family ATPase [Pseudomonas aeruginosa]AEO76802.1 hypothetical protein PAM18_4321 [Pseudomonas aeruginosa M18]MBX5509311.1 AAA family ATPase [Pseudomonas aeruginosa]MBX5534063.1 AAA family ATPase [Pseudomonas aeruginosa]MCR3831527.1 AAA family ATPase [Pseudomonas aeruginosa]MCU8974352.1 AAA family ATPase [Pseudomonas aeruginosa]